MKILYFGKEQTGGFIETIFTVQGGYVANINEEYVEYVDWTSFEFVRVLTDDEVNIGIPNTMRHYNEYWTRDDDPSIVSTTWKLTKINNGVKETDPDGHTWSKHKDNWTDTEEAAIIGFDKKWLEGKLVTVAKSAYAKLNIDTGVVEKETHYLQLQQAQEYKKTGSAGILLSTLASDRGETVAILANKIIEKNRAYEERLAKILGLQQKIRKELHACTNIREVQKFAEKYTDLYFFNDGTIQKNTIHEQFKNIS